MKTRYILSSITAAIFILSHALPALEGYTGFSCFLVCANILIGYAGSEIAACLYDGGFAISNIAFVAFTIFSFTKRNFTRKFRVIIAILSLHVLSWPLLNISHIEGIKIGYYVWLLAYLMMVYVSTKYRKKTTENQSPEPMTMTVTPPAAQASRQP